MADLARLHRFGEDAQHLLERCEALLRMMLVHQPAEGVDAALRPMKLIEVDIVGLQPLQAVIDGGEDIAPVELVVAAADGLEAPVGPDDLGGEDHLVAFLAAGEPGADDPLGIAEALLGRRHRIHLRRVPEIDAALQRVIHLGMAVRLAVLPPPGHGAQADCADRDVSSS